jgi:hypothetical protein
MLYLPNSDVTLLLRFNMDVDPENRDFTDGVHMSRLLITLAISALTLTGCGGQSTASRDTMPGSGIAPMPHPQASPEQSLRADALSQTTSAYAQEMESHLYKGVPQPSANPNLPQEPVKSVDQILSKVNWGEPKEVNLTLGPPQSTEAPAKISTPAPLETAAAPQPQQPAPPSLRENQIASNDLLSSLTRAVKDDPKNLSAQLDLQLLHLLLGHATPQMDTISPLPAEDRELLATIIDGFNNFRSLTRSEMNLMLAKKVRPLIEMSDRLRSQADLRIANPALCSKVDGFGAYELMSASAFAVGREHSALLYCEVENFSSHLNGNKQWETHLTQDFAIYNDRGQRVWEEKRQPISDTCRNRRRDFFVVRRIRIPGHLPTGQYSLKISIADPQSNRGAQSTLAISIVGH